MDWNRLSALAQQDPGHRGILRSPGVRRIGGAIPLQRAAAELAERGRKVGIVTGFPILVKGHPVPETDGPPGALYLASSLERCGMEVVLLIEPYGLQMLRAAARAMGVHGPVESLAGLDLEQPTSRFTHLIAVERPGPSHTIRSLVRQLGNNATWRDIFVREVPRHHRGVCHDMRGRSIAAWTAPVHRWFEMFPPRNRPFTIGIGDGGNEIGFGKVPWRTLRRFVPNGLGARIACRVATDVLISAGVSNWGAYALARGVAGLRGLSTGGWDRRRHVELLELLSGRFAVLDGVTRRAEPTVDGLSTNAYLAVFDAILRAGNRRQ